MKGKWLVKLLREPVPNTYGPGYFPRAFIYKADADSLARRVREAGGEVEVVFAKGLNAVRKALGD